MAEKSDLLKPKLALTEFPKQLMVSKHLKHKSKILLMLCLGTRVDEDIVDKHDNKLVQIWMENPVHQIHEHGRGISQAEWHDKELKRPITSQESGLRDIIIPDPKLMIARTKISLRKLLRSLQLVKQVVDTRQWIPIPNGDLV